MACFNFPGVFCVPQAWQGWRTLATPATWTLPSRLCLTGKTLPPVYLPSVPHLPHHFSDSAFLLCVFFLLSSHYSNFKCFFSVAICCCIHCLPASCWLWEITMVMLIGESDGWVKIAAVHHLRQQKWPFVDPCRVFCYLLPLLLCCSFSFPTMSHYVPLLFISHFIVYWNTNPSDSFFMIGTVIWLLVWSL